MPKKRKTQGSTLIINGTTGTLFDNATGIPFKVINGCSRNDIINKIITLGYINIEQFFLESDTQLVKINTKKNIPLDTRIHFNDNSINGILVIKKRKKRLLATLKNINTGFVYKKTSGNSLDSIIAKLIRQGFFQEYRSTPKGIKVKMNFKNHELFKDVNKHAPINSIIASLSFEKDENSFIGTLANLATGYIYKKISGKSKNDIIKKLIEQNYIPQSQFYPNTKKIYIKNPIPINAEANISISESEITQAFYRVYLNKSANYTISFITEATTNGKTDKYGNLTPQRFLIIMQSKHNRFSMGITFDGKNIRAFSGKRSVKIK